jgi:hypothetical protein
MQWQGKVFYFIKNPDYCCCYYYLPEVVNIIFFCDIISYQYHGQKSDIISCIYHFKKNDIISYHIIIISYHIISYHIISYIILIFTIT